MQKTALHSFQNVLGTLRAKSGKDFPPRPFFPNEMDLFLCKNGDRAPGLLPHEKLFPPTEQNNEEKCGEDFATERSLSTGRVGGISFFLSGRRAVRMGSLHIKIGRAIPYTDRMLRILHSSVK